MLDKLTPKQTLWFLVSVSLLWGMIMAVMYVISASQMTAQGMEYNFRIFVRNQFVGFIYFWFLNIALYGYVFRYIDIAKKGNFATVYIVALLVSLLYSFIVVVSRGGSPGNHVSALGQTMLFYNVLFFACYLLARYKSSQQKLFEALQLENRNTQLELALADLRMQALQAQLEPHFLFNALHSVGGLIRINERSKALTAISQLSDLLRFAVEVSDKKLAALSRELEFVRDYVSLQGMRFGENIQVRIDNQCHDDQLQIPPFTLQLLIENAISHGTDAGGGNVGIDMVLLESEGYLRLEVTNPQGEGDKNKNGFGIGLDNLKKRLEMIYGDDYSLEIDSEKGVFRVKLKLPVRESD